MAASHFSKSNVIAGLFLLMALAMGVAMSFALSARAGFGPTAPVVVRFSVEDGAAGIKSGAPVNLGGQPVGRVTGVSIATTREAGAARPVGVDVELEVRADLAIFENARISVEQPLLGTLSTINIDSVGDPATLVAHSGSGPVVERGERVTGSVSPPALLKQAGFGSEQSGQLRQAIKGLNESVEALSGLVTRTAPSIEASVGDARAILGALRKDLDEWIGRLDAILANAEAASGKLEPLLAKADEGVESFRVVAGEVRELVGANRQKLDSIIAGVESITGKVDRETVDALNVALRDGRAALAKASLAIDDLATLTGGEAPNLKRILANLRLMSDNLKLTAVEVRSQPWRLLVQPTTKEFESQVLYDATRAYAEGASDVRAASESLRALRAGGADGEAIEAASRRLADSIADYAAREQRLLDVLVESKGKP